MNEQEFEELAAGDALHALSSDDAARYRKALIEHPEWQATADADAATAAALAEGVAPVAAPDMIRSALLDRIAVTPQHAESIRASDEPSAQKVPRRRLRVLFALAACLALIVGVGISAVAINGQLNRPASAVALEEIHAAKDAEEATVAVASGGTVTAHWSDSLGTAVLVTDDIATLPTDKAYELWFVRGDAAVPAGLIATSGGDASTVLVGDLREGDIIAITVEQAGGSPSGAPTTEPVVAIPTT